MITVLTLSYNGRDFTEKFVESIRRNSDLPYELIIVDNGSEASTQEWVEKVADRSIIFTENRGFSGGFNAGLEIAQGEYVIFANNDTEFPPNWDKQLIEVFEKHPDAGIVTPVYTSGRKSARRMTPGSRIRKVPAYGKYPSGVAFMMRTDFVKSIGGWNEEYLIASGEDADLCFTVWKEGYEIYIDERVLLIHEGKVTSTKALEDWRQHFKKNSRQFKKKWYFEYHWPMLARIFRRNRA